VASVVEKQIRENPRESVDYYVNVFTRGIYGDLRA